MTDKQREALRELRDSGYAVIVWTPEELGNADVNRVQDRLIELGFEVISDLQSTEEL